MAKEFNKTCNKCVHFWSCGAYRSLVLLISGSKDFEIWIKQTQDVESIQADVDDRQKYLSYELAEKYAQYCKLYVRSCSDMINRGPK
jgi:hypothetical protein